MTPKNPDLEDHLHLRFWFFTFLAFGGVIWLLHGMLLPFILGIAIAYFLDPLVRSMHKAGLARWASSLIVLLSFIALITGASLILMPLLSEQAKELLAALPGYVETLQNELWPRLKDILEHIPSVDITKLQNSFAAYTGDAVNFAGKVVGQVVTGSMALLDILALILLTPVVAFYLMRDWPKIIKHVDGILPQRYAPTIHRELKNIDTMIAGFVRGQAMVSVCLAIVYSVGLSLAGLKYGMVIGLVAGFVSFIPIVGTVVGVVVSLILAVIQFDSIGPVLGIAGIFVFAQLLDANVLTPKLVGDRVGLHPVWIIFAIMAGGKLLGLVGVMLAVPLAGTLAILLRLAIRRYRASRYFS